MPGVHQYRLNLLLTSHDLKPIDMEKQSFLDELTSKAKTRQQVADEYGICVHTLNTRLVKANIFVDPGLIFPKILKTIYETFGMPNDLKHTPK